MTDNVNKIVERLDELSGQDLEQVIIDAKNATAQHVWIPNPGPQTQAYFSKADTLLFGGAPGGGKDVTKSTVIITPQGWTTMGAILVGNQVFDRDGNICNVIAKSSERFPKSYKVLFSDGSEIVCSDSHGWITRTRQERVRAYKQTDDYREKRKAARLSRISGTKSKKFTESLIKRNKANAQIKQLPYESVRNTQEIFNTLHRQDGGVNHSIDVCKPLILPEVTLPIDPYVLGAWIGDGTHNCGIMTGYDEEIYSNIAKYYEVSTQKDAKRRNIKKFTKALKANNLYKNKHIPAQYLRSSFDQRLALLQGLNDTDGYCDKRGQCEITQVRKHLIDQIHELILSLGIKATVREGVAKLNGRITGPNYRIKFITDIPVFRVTRKLERQKMASFRGTHDVRYIINIEEVEPVAMQCIQVDSPSSTYLVGRSMIPTHNSQLILGLAFNNHRRSLLLRRKYSDLSRLIDDALKINKGKNGFRGTPQPRLALSADRMIDFGAAQHIGDEQKYMGQGRDFLGVDECTHFAEQQVRFVMGWNRTEYPTQRVRTVFATNPPLQSEGLWVIQMFAPWLDPAFPVQLKPGQLGWVVSDERGKDLWVDGPNPVMISGREVRPKSRTYIPSAVADNPYYAKTDYERELQNMPEPYRSLLLGGFKTRLQDAERQLIPTEWTRQAMTRWTNHPPPGVPMCAIAADVARGGMAETTIAMRYGWWFDEIIGVPGEKTPTGKDVTALIITNRKDNAEIIVDMGGGYGSSVYDFLVENQIRVIGYKGAGASNAKTKCGTLGFFNKRSEIWWKFREALDPAQAGGSPVHLPDDPVLLADLCAPRLDMGFNGVKIDSKEKLIKELGRSPDRGDAVVMAWAYGANYTTHAKLWKDKEKNSFPQVIRKRRR